MVHFRKPQWAFVVLLISLIMDMTNILRLVRGAMPGLFFVPWMVAGLATVFLTFDRKSSRARRILLWIILSLGILLVSFLSDGTNLSLWVWIAPIIGGVTTVPYRQVVAGLLGLAHVVAQIVLVPLPTSHALLPYGMILLLGFIGLLVWHQGHRPPMTQERTL